MTIHIETAKRLTYGQTLRYTAERTPGDFARTVNVRVSGKPQVWKTRPGDFKVPVKYGLYESFYLDQNNAYLFDLES